MQYASVASSWPMCLVLGLTLPRFRQIGSPALKRISHELAKYSYGIYLSHSFALALGFYVLRTSPLWLQLAVSFASIAVAQ